MTNNPQISKSAETQGNDLVLNLINRKEFKDALAVTPEQAAEKLKATLKGIDLNNEEAVIDALDAAAFFKPGTKASTIAKLAKRCAVLQPKDLEVSLSIPAETKAPAISAEESLQKVRSQEWEMLSSMLEIDLKDIQNPQAVAEAILAHEDLVQVGATYDKKTWKESFGYEPANNTETIALNRLLARLAIENPKTAENKVGHLRDYDARVTSANVEYFRTTDKFKTDSTKEKVETAIRAGMLLKSDEEPKTLTDVHYQEYFNNARAVDAVTGKPIEKRYDAMKDGERNAHFEAFLKIAKDDVNLAGALAVIVSDKENISKVYGTKGLPGLGEEFWRSMGYQPDGSFGSSELKSLNLLFLRAQYCPQFVEFLKTKLANIGKDAKVSADAGKEAQESLGTKLFRELGIKEDAKHNILIENVNIQSAIDTVYAYAIRNGDGFNHNLSYDEWKSRGYVADGYFGSEELATLNQILVYAYNNGKVDQKNLAILRKYSSNPTSGIKNIIYDKNKDKNDGRLKGNTAPEVKENLEKELRPETKMAMYLLDTHPEFKKNILRDFGFTKKAIEHLAGRADRLELALDMIATGALVKNPEKGNLSVRDLTNRGFTAGFEKDQVNDDNDAWSVPGTRTALNDLRANLIKNPVDFKNTIHNLDLYLRSPEGEAAFQDGNYDQNDQSVTTDRFNQTKYLSQRVADNNDNKEELLSFICDFNLDGKTDEATSREVKKGENTNLYMEKALMEGMTTGLNEKETARALFLLAEYGGLNLDEEVQKGAFNTKTFGTLTDMTPERAVAYIRAYPAVKPYITAGINKLGGGFQEIISFIKGKSSAIDKTAQILKDQQNIEDAKKKEALRIAEAEKAKKEAAEKAKKEAAEKAKKEAAEKAEKEAAERAAKEAPKTPENKTSPESLIANEAIANLKEARTAANTVKIKASETYALGKGRTAPFTKEDTFPAALEKAKNTLAQANAAKVEFDAKAAAFNAAVAKLDKQDLVSGKTVRGEFPAPFPQRAQQEAELALLATGVAEDIKHATDDLKAWQDGQKEKIEKVLPAIEKANTDTKYLDEQFVNIKAALNMHLDDHLKTVDFDGLGEKNEIAHRERVKKMVLKKFDTARQDFREGKIDERALEDYLRTLVARTKTLTQENASDFALMDYEEKLPNLQEGIAENKKIRLGKKLEKAIKNVRENGNKVTFSVDNDEDVTFGKQSLDAFINSPDNRWLTVNAFKAALKTAREMDAAKYQAAIASLGANPTMIKAWDNRENLFRLLK